MPKYEPEGRQPIEAKCWSFDDLGGLELYRAQHFDHRYPPHAHDEYCICVNTAGHGRWRCKGSLYLPQPGQFFVLNPGEISEGETQGSPFSIRTFYLPASLLGELLGLAPDALPRFDTTLVHNPELAYSLAAAHLQADRRGSDLATSEMLIAAFRSLGKQYARGVYERPQSHARAEVRRVVDYLEASYDRKIGLTELAKLVGLSRDHMIRSFRAEMGLTPFAFLDGIRVRHARALLRQGKPIQSVALDVGFYDQSHLTNRFKRVVGVTPGQYTQAIS